MPLDCSQPFVFGVQNQRFSFCGIGLCDPQLVGTVNGVIPFVYQHVHFQWTIDQGATQDIISPATGTTVDAFTTGMGETVPGAWWLQNSSDTNLLEKRGGAPVGRNFMFIGRGIIADVPPAFSQFSDSATAARYIPQFLNNAPNGSFYQGQLQEWTLNAVEVELRQSDTGCQYRLGLLKHMPGFIGVSGPQTTRNGLISVVGFVPFTVAVCFGSEDDIRQISLVLKFGQQIRIENNDAQPTTTVQGNILYQAIELTIIGNICYVPDVYACQPPNGIDRGVLTANGLALPI